MIKIKNIEIQFKNCPGMVNLIRQSIHIKVEFKVCKPLVGSICYINPNKYGTKEYNDNFLDLVTEIYNHLCGNNHKITFVEFYGYFNNIIAAMV